MIVGLWRHRRFIWDAALNDLRYRYAGSGLGAFWNIVTPLALLTLYTFIFRNVFVVRSAGGNVGTGLFVLYLASGFLPWGAFAECVASSTQALLTNSPYLKKMPIPEQVFVAQSAVASTLSMLLIVVLLLGCALVLGQPPTWTWVFLPFVVVLWQVLGFGLGLALATLNVFFRDVAHMIGVLFQIWMWSLPVVYAEDLLPNAYRALLVFNPAYPFLRAVRDAYISAQPPGFELWFAMLGWSAVATIAGFVILRLLRSEIRDVL
jgi:lipopolysaccharide transport system permease protein